MFFDGSDWQMKPIGGFATDQIILIYLLFDISQCNIVSGICLSSIQKLENTC